MKTSLIIKGLAKREFYTANVQPVYGGYYKFIDQIPDSYTPPPWKRLPHSEWTDGFIHSTRLRYTVRALRDAIEEKGKWVLTAATVDLSTSTSNRLVKNSRSPVTVYGNHLRDRFRRRLGYKPEFIAVLEESRGKLHAHLLLGHPTGQENVIKKLINEDSTGASNATLIRQSFKRWSRAKRGSADFYLEELDREANRSCFPHSGGPFRFYQICAIDSGWLDYLSKTLTQNTGLIGRYRRFYCPNHLASRAQELYDRKRREYLALVRE